MEHYARKRFLRKKTLKETREDQTILRKFEQELSNLKRLSHEHLVTVIGSYTDQRSVAFLMEPVADCNLLTYLRQPRSFINDHMPSLRSYFGCLANAVAYLHKQKIQHRDLKPENVLIKTHQVYVTDFGTALDWSQKGRETTVDPNVPRTERYMSPEVEKRFPKNSASDMWSLGIVFLEMTTVLRGHDIQEMRRHSESKGTRHPFVWGNPQATHEWFEVLRGAKSGLESDNEPLTWIKDLTHRDPQKRPQAWELTIQIREAASSCAFIGQCCAKEDESEYDQSPPLSANSGEFDKVDLTEQLAALDLDEKPFGSFLEPSSQQSVEKWLDFSQSFVPNEPSQFIPNEAPQLVSNEAPQLDSNEMLQFPALPIPGSFPDEPMKYELSEPKDQSISPESSEISSSLNQRIVDEGVGYEIEEDSDEEDNNSSFREYDIAEDSSGSERTIRAFPLAAQSLQDSTLDSPPAPGEEIISDNQFQTISPAEVCAELDKLEEDPIEVIPKSTSRELNGPVPHSLVRLTDSAPKAPLEDPPNDFGKSPPKVPDASETTAVVEDLASGNESPTMPLKEVCPQLDKLREDPTKAIPKSTSRDFSGPISDSLETPINSAPKASPKIPDIPKASSENLSKHLSEDHGKTVESGPLSFENISRLDASAPRKPPSKKKPKVTATGTRSIGDEPQISPDVYMEEVWEAASTAETSVISQRTKATFNSFGSGLAWQDKSLNLLEKYVKKGSAGAVKHL